MIHGPRKLFENSPKYGKIVALIKVGEVGRLSGFREVATQHLSFSKKILLELRPERWPSHFERSENDLEEQSDERRSMAEGEWWLYIIECRNKEFYVGIAKNVQERVVAHNRGQACRYTKFRGPVQLIYREVCGSYTDARRREKQVKRYSRAKKLALLSSV